MVRSFFSHLVKKSHFLACFMSETAGCSFLINIIYDLLNINVINVKTYIYYLHG